MAEPQTSVFGFLRRSKKFWLLPLVLVLVIFALLVLASVGSEENFIYTLE